MNKDLIKRLALEDLERSHDMMMKDEFISVYNSCDSELENSDDAYDLYCNLYCYYHI